MLTLCSKALPRSVTGSLDGTICQYWESPDGTASSLAFEWLAEGVGCGQLKPVSSLLLESPEIPQPRVQETGPCTV